MYERARQKARSSQVEPAYGLARLNVQAGLQGAIEFSPGTLNPSYDKTNIIM
jgi:hypothetical protein